MSSDGSVEMEGAAGSAMATGSGPGRVFIDGLQSGVDVLRNMRSGAAPGVASTKDYSGGNPAKRDFTDCPGFTTTNTFQTCGEALGR
jgi:hypothetical protein